MHVRGLATALSIGAAVFMSACGGGGGDPAPTGSGMLRAALVDAPACGYEHVYVTVERLRVHRSAGASEGESGWSEIALAAPRRVDLLTLRNGVVMELGQTELPAGTYQQLRLVLAESGTQPLAHAVVPTGGSEVALDTPSGSQTGLKAQVGITVAAGQTADVLVDFDACKSVVPRGQSGRYTLKPVIRVLPRIQAAGARVVGHVDTRMAGATVSVQSAGVSVASTVPDPMTGRFELFPVPDGSYTLVIAGGSRATGVVTGVPVRADLPTQLNLPTSPILLPEGAPRGLMASVIAAPSLLPATASLRLVQTLTGGPPIDVLGVPLEPNAGARHVQVASASPWVAPFVAGAAAPVFAVDSGTGVTGRYRAEATLTPAGAAALVKSQDVDVSAALPDPLPDLAFAFP